MLMLGQVSWFLIFIISLPLPQGRMLVLDLASEIEPQYGRLESYFGQPFIFCMLHNYGGVDGLFGNVQSLLKVSFGFKIEPSGT